MVGVYAGAVTLLGALLETRANLGVSLVATGIVAILFSPLRLRLQRAVDRLFYGRRDDPYAVVTQLAQAACRGRARADSARAGRGVAVAPKLPRVGIELRGGARLRTVAAAAIRSCWRSRSTGRTSGG